MITKQKEYNEAGYQCTFWGLSSDRGGLTGMKNGDLYYEIDTAKLYVYNETGETWVEQ